MPEIKMIVLAQVSLSPSAERLTGALGWNGWRRHPASFGWHAAGIKRVWHQQADTVTSPPPHWQDASTFTLTKVCVNGKHVSIVCACYVCIECVLIHNHKSLFLSLSVSFSTPLTHNNIHMLKYTEKHSLNLTEFCFSVKNQVGQLADSNSHIH